MIILLEILAGGILFLIIIDGSFSESKDRLLLEYLSVIMEKIEKEDIVATKIFVATEYASMVLRIFDTMGESLGFRQRSRDGNARLLLRVKAL